MEGRAIYDEGQRRETCKKSLLAVPIIERGKLEALSVMNKVLAASVSEKFHQEVRGLCKAHDLTVKQLILRGIRSEMTKVQREALWKRK